MTIAILICGITMVVASFILTGRQAEKAVDEIAKIGAEEIKAEMMKRAEMTRQERLEALKQHFLARLVEDPLDGTPFDMEVLRSIEALQQQYRSGDATN